MNPSRSKGLEGFIATPQKANMRQFPRVIDPPEVKQDNFLWYGVQGLKKHNETIWLDNGST